MKRIKIVKIGLIIYGILFFGFAKAQYSVTIAPTTNGAVTADKDDQYEKGDTVKLTILPDMGYELADIFTYKTEGPETLIDLTVENDAVRTFPMPAFDVTVTATFKKKPDLEAIEKAKKLIEGMEGLAVEQKTSTTEAMIKKWLEAKINSLTGMNETGIIVTNETITILSFNAAKEGTSTNLDGTNGSFTFIVSLKKGEISLPTIELQGIITATPYTETTYNVSIGDFIDGKVISDKSSAIAGEKVTLTILPDKGFELDLISAIHADGNPLIPPPNEINDTTYIFTMPAYDVIVKAVFKKTADLLAIDTATYLIERMEVLKVEQDTANTESSIITWLIDTINVLISSTGITITESDILITLSPASYGYNGSFDFTISLTKGSLSDYLASSSGIIIATRDCQPKTCIIQKSGSNILICKEATGIHIWGYIDASNKEYKIESDSTNYQYFDFKYEFNHIINTMNCKYFVEIKYNDNCSTRTYYDPNNKCEEFTKSLPIYKITAYPNPAKHQLSVMIEKDINGIYMVFLRNIVGQTVFSKQFADYRKNEVLSVDFNLPAGIYVLTVETKGEVLTSKIIIE